jgi:uncharacterized membrane-anchored protein
MTIPPPRGEAPRAPTVIASLTNGSPWTRPLSNKVPEASPSFWLLTLLSTTVGTTTARSLSATLGSGLGMSATTAIVSLVTAGALLCQLSLGRHVPGSYWLCVVLVVVLGTLLSRDPADTLAMSFWVATGVFGAAVVVALAGWRSGEPPVSVNVALTRRREASYWFVVLCAFSLGTSIGELVSDRLDLGYASSALFLCGLMAVIAFAHRGLHLNAVATSWAAYVVVCALGACLAAFLTTTSAVLLEALLGVVGFVASRAHRTARRRSGAGQVGIPTVAA